VYFRDKFVRTSAYDLDYFAKKKKENQQMSALACISVRMWDRATKRARNGKSFTGHI
jgi:hypothetical protein